MDIFKIAGKIGLLIQTKTLEVIAFEGLMPLLFDIGMAMLSSCSKKVRASEANGLGGRGVRVCVCVCFVLTFGFFVGGKGLGG